MEENKEPGGKTGEKDSKETKVEDQEIHGRLYNSKNPAFKNKDSIDDISFVDEQEGTMNHGTVGGNMGEEDKEDNHKQNQDQ